VLVLTIVLIVLAVVIVGGVIAAAMGRGGELAGSGADVRPLDGDIVTAADVALLRPPAALWGYDMRATDEALNRVARTVTERDVEIAELRQQLADMRSAEPRPGINRSADPWPGINSSADPWREINREAGPRPGISRPAHPRHAVRPAAEARSSDTTASDVPDHATGPTAAPFQRGAGGAARPPAGESPWPTWEQTGPAALPDPGEPGSGTGGSA
jgi:hypothetical protein